MKIKVLASGSRGNCTYVETENTKILIDAGITTIRLNNLLKKINVSLTDIDAILISHTHDDHISGLASIAKKTDAKIYITIELLQEIRRRVPIDSIEVINDKFMIGDLETTLLPTSHDVKSYGFLIECNNKSLVYITDTGYINRKHYETTENKDIYIIEANHNEEMLMNGPYPYYLKQRVIGDKGHLSNSTTGRYLNKTIGKNTKYVVLAHISEKNNTEILAYEEVTTAMKDCKFDGRKIIIAKQDEALEEIIV